MSDDPLYAKIMAFQFDEGPVSLTFTERLQRENGWSLNYASRIVNEYLRFIYLLATSDQPLTPSDQVDQVWHLHLTYTESYWQRLCAEVVGRPLHHTPTRGGIDESDKFNSWYKRTLASYQRVFGSAPPADIWPSPKTRFGEDLHFQRVNTCRFWVVGKPQMLRTHWQLCLVLVSGFVVAGCIGWAVTDDRIWLDLAVFTSAFYVTSMVINLYLDRCLSCHRFGGLKATGVVDARADKKEYVELRCKYCGTQVWKEHRSGGDGGCGCG